MAARKARQHAAADASDEATHPSAPPSETPGRPTFGVAAVLFVLWFAMLAGLAIWTANPVTLNRLQLESADLVAEATVEDVKTGACRIVQSWPPGAAGQTIRVSGLSSLPVTAGETYLFALSRDTQGNGYAIVATPPPEAAPLVYPATDDARRQLTEILDAQLP